MKKSSLSTIFVIIAGVLWSTMGLSVKKLSAAGLSSFHISAYRFLGGLAAILIFALLRDPKLFKIKARDIPLFILTGAVGLTGTSLTYYATIAHEGMGVAAVLMYLEPVLVIFASRFIFREKITAVKAIACGIAIAGCALVSGILSISHISLLYFCLGIGSALCYGAYSIVSKVILNRGYDTFTIILYSYIFGTAALLPVSDYRGLFTLLNAEPKLYLFATALAVPSCALAYVFYTKALTYGLPGKAAIMGSLEPALAAVWGVLVYRENLDAFKVIGVILVLSSVVIVGVDWKEVLKRSARPL